MNKKYCSIDLEFTGFDPEKEQILEIGFAFFEFGSKGLEVTETWSQVFNPGIEVHQKILGLTGIAQSEIDTAPSISEFREFLSEKLSDVVLVAHNPTLDVKFLELAGVQLSGKVIDTLELVQFLLPTHHSYNLENLMHYFGIEHKDSHRALGDSLSTISLIERMIQIFSELPKTTQDSLMEVMSRGEFLWQDILLKQVTKQTFVANDSLKKNLSDNLEVLDINQQLIIDSNIDNHEIRVAKSFQNADDKVLIALTNKSEVLNLWKEGLVEGVFEDQDLFNRDSFDEFLKQAATSEELRFCLKVLVWLATNWQTKTILDLNLSFFGGQFKSNIVGGRYESCQSKIAACDFRTLQVLAQDGLEQDRILVICDLQRFEKFLTSDSKEKLSWTTFTFILRSIYNPELDLGKAELANQVVSALSATDLFFGLVQIMLKQFSKHEDYVELGKLDSYQSVYMKRITEAALNLSDRLLTLSQEAEHPGLERKAKELQEFFDLKNGVVKWIELDAENVSLHSQSVEVKEYAQEIYQNFLSVKLTDSISHPKLLFFFIDRLGFNTEIISKAQAMQKFEITLIDQQLHIQENLYGVIKDLDAPLVVVFPTTGGIKSFYKDYFEGLKELFHLFAQEYSGSGNKIFRNFRIFPNSLLLATSFFINKQKYQAPAQSLLYVSWPEIDNKHPYYQKLQEKYQTEYPEVYDILALSHIILNFKQTSSQHLPKLFGSKEFFTKWNKLIP